MILSDLQKAFNTIDHDVLFQNLYIIFIPKYTANRLKSFLFSNRPFQINLGNTFAQLAFASCRVPQSSVFGLLLFLIYFNGMSQVIKCHLFLCDDDS